MRELSVDSTCPHSQRGRFIVSGAVVAIALACLLLPIASNRIPPLLDYAGNVARVKILYDLIHGSGFSNIYRIVPAVVPNLGIDVLGLSLMEMGLSVEAAGRLVLVLTLISLAVGVLALHRANFRHASLWPVLAIPFLIQEGSIWGFVNYLLSLGLSLCVVAAWQCAASCWSLLAAATGLCFGFLLLFFCHLVGFLLAAGTVIGIELSRLLWPIAVSSLPADQLVIMRRPRVARLVAVLAACVPPLFLLAIAPMMTMNAPPHMGAFLHELGYRPLIERVERLIGFAYAYDTTLDNLCLIVIAAIVAIGAATRRLRIYVPMVLPIGGLLVIYLFIPDGWFGTASLPDRLPMALFLLTVAATDLHAPRRWQFGLLAGIAVLLALARGISVDVAWRAVNRGVQPLFETLRSLPAGSRIYIALAYKGDFIFSNSVVYDGTPAYFVMKREGYYAHVYTTPAQNIVLPRAAYAAAPKMPYNYRLDKPHPLTNGDNPYAAKRLSFYDYVLVVNPAYWPVRPPSGLTPISSGPNYLLLKIDKHLYPR